MNTLATSLAVLASVYLIVYAFGTLKIELLGFIGFGFSGFWLFMLLPALGDDHDVWEKWLRRGKGDE